VNCPSQFRKEQRETRREILPVKKVTEKDDKPSLLTRETDTSTQIDAQQIEEISSELMI